MSPLLIVPMTATATTADSTSCSSSGSTKRTKSVDKGKGIGIGIGIDFNELYFVCTNSSKQQFPSLRALLFHECAIPTPDSASTADTAELSVDSSPPLAEITEKFDEELMTSTKDNAQTECTGTIFVPFPEETFRLLDKTIDAAELHDYLDGRILVSSFYGQRVEACEVYIGIDWNMIDVYQYGTKLGGLLELFASKFKFVTHTEDAPLILCRNAPNMRNIIFGHGNLRETRATGGPSGDDDADDNEGEEMINDESLPPLDVEAFKRHGIEAFRIKSYFQYKKCRKTMRLTVGEENGRFSLHVHSKDDVFNLIALLECRIHTLKVAQTRVIATLGALLWHLEQNCIIADCQRHIGLQFNDTLLLKYALSTPSAGLPVDYERYEILGDSLLKLLCSLHLLVIHPYDHEGQLTAAKCKLINNRHLFNRAFAIKIYRYIISVGFVSKHYQPLGYRRDGIYRMLSDKTLADVIEAIIGAYYLDCDRNLQLLWTNVFVNSLEIVSKEEAFSFSNIGLLRELARPPESQPSESEMEISLGIGSILGYSFKNTFLLASALTHASYFSLDRVMDMGMHQSSGKRRLDGEEDCVIDMKQILSTAAGAADFAGGAVGGAAGTEDCSASAAAGTVGGAAGTEDCSVTAGAATAIAAGTEDGDAGTVHESELCRVIHTLYVYTLHYLHIFP
jgi:dsRNA-specific ribonuclease